MMVLKKFLDDGTTKGFLIKGLKGSFIKSLKGSFFKGLKNMS